ncbi:hypothetical protein [Saccharibacillus deserti]|uniref:hypothetical protein n=1 Tax=Saccharibacillus deserti TaxID=1634444 RepID=UPI00155337BF|nr:hypothetical protein [Saccharibacillus deserti]
MSVTYSSNESVMDFFEFRPTACILVGMIKYYCQTTEQHKEAIDRIMKKLLKSRIQPSFAAIEVFHEIRLERLSKQNINEKAWLKLFKASPTEALEEMFQEPINLGKYRRFLERGGDAIKLFKIHSEAKEEKFMSAINKLN